MGKLLTGRYGRSPEAESIPLELIDASQKLGLKPSDFVSEGPPNFFHKAYGAPGRYLVFQLEGSEVQASPIWKPGYYLLPLEASDVLRALEKNRQNGFGSDHRKALPVEVEMDATPPPAVQERLDAWVSNAQPLFFKCGCDYLELKAESPWGLRRRWKIRLRCPKRCQPVLKALL